MKNFYGTATNQKGVSFRVPVEANERYQAETEAQAYCSRNALKYEQVCMVKGSNNGEGVLTKNTRQRKLDGTQGKWFF